MRTLQIDLSPEQLHDPASLRRVVAAEMGCAVADVPQHRVVRRAIDCRRRNVLYHCTIELAEAGGQFAPAESLPPMEPLRADAPRVIVVGAGPAGLFAALRALELGMRPIIVERGKPVEQRKYDIAALTRQKRVDPDSNWCFGEGGAGTYSDGKLYTRSTKRGDVGAVLRRFVAYGADPDIMLDAHAHIGTDRLGGIIANMRRNIEEHGGEYHFGMRVDNLVLRNDRVVGVHCADGSTIEGCAVVLATGHSARDIYRLFHSHGWMLEAKPFAIGVRVEHPQSLINEIQYHGPHYSTLLPPAAYSLTTQVCTTANTRGNVSGQHGVFSFCMCPGGVIVPAATADGQQVVNGMSNSRRNSPYANSGIAVTVGPEDVGSDDVFALLDFQMAVEQSMFHAGGDAINAPSQRLTDFLRRRTSPALGATGYMGDTVSAPLHELLPQFVADCLMQGFRDFDRKMRGFVTDEATLLAVESRTSSPVRIPRDRLTMQHPQLAGLYPCGEGAGYAGGIVSSALDGIACIETLKKNIAAQ